MEWNVLAGEEAVEEAYLEEAEERRNRASGRYVREFSIMHPAKDPTSTGEATVLMLDGSFIALKRHKIQWGNSFKESEEFTCLRGVDIEGYGPDCPACEARGNRKISTYDYYYRTVIDEREIKKDNRTFQYRKLPVPAQRGLHDLLRAAEQRVIDGEIQGHLAGFRVIFKRMIDDKSLRTGIPQQILGRVDMREYFAKLAAAGIKEPLYPYFAAVTDSTPSDAVRMSASSTPITHWSDFRAARIARSLRDSEAKLNEFWDALAGGPVTEKDFFPNGWYRVVPTEENRPIDPLPLDYPALYYPRKKEDMLKVMAGQPTRQQQTQTVPTTAGAPALFGNRPY